MWVLFRVVDYEGDEYLGAFAKLEDAVLQAEFGTGGKKYTWRWETLDKLVGTSKRRYDTHYEILSEKVQRNVFDENGHSSARVRIPPRQLAPEPRAPKPPRAMKVVGGRAV